VEVPRHKGTETKEGRKEIQRRKEIKKKIGTSCEEGVLGSGGIVPRILDLGTRWR